MRTVYHAKPPISVVRTTFTGKSNFLARFGAELLEHSRVRQEIRIIEFLCTARAVSRAGTAFNTGARNIRRVVRVNRTHRADFRAQTAVLTQHHHRARLGLQELCGRFVGLKRRVVGCLRVTRYLRRLDLSLASQLERRTLSSIRSSLRSAASGRSAASLSENTCRHKKAPPAAGLKLFFVSSSHISASALSYALPP